MKLFPWLLPGILLVAIILRFYSLSSSPPSLYWDEYDTGYQAYSLLSTGRDYFGNLMPLFPHSLSDFRTPANLYLLVPVIKFFGLSAFSVRFTSSIFGIISVFLIFLVAYLLTKSKPTAVFASLVLALSPWHVLFSRTALDGIALMLAFFLTGLILYSRKKSFFLSGLFFSLSLVSYSPAKLFIPLFIITLFATNSAPFSQGELPAKCGVRGLISKKFILFILGLSLFAIPVYADSLFGSSNTRFHDIAVITDPTLAKTVDNQRLSHQLSQGKSRAVGMTPSFYDKLITNKPILIASILSKNYLDSFSSQFLFTIGDYQLRHSPSQNSIGQFNWIEFIPLLTGILIFSNLFHKSPSRKLILSWLFLSPIPAALTRDGGAHAGRTFFLLPVLVIIIACGINYLYKRQKLFFTIYLVSFFLTSLLIFDNLFSFYRLESAKDFNWGFSEIVALAQEKASQYDSIVIDAHNENVLMSYLFFTKYQPQKFSQMLPFHLTEIAKNTQAVKINNLYFVTPGVRGWTDLWSKRASRQHDLLILASDLPLADTLSRVGTIYYPDGTPAYFLSQAN